MEELKKKLADARKKIEQTLGKEALKNGEVEEKFRETPIVGEYSKLKKQLEEMEVAESLKAQVFNDLYSFFSKY